MLNKVPSQSLGCALQNARYFLLPDKHKADADIETGMTRKRCLLKLVDLPAAALRKLSPAELEEPSMKARPRLPCHSKLKP